MRSAIARRPSVKSSVEGGRVAPHGALFRLRFLFFAMLGEGEIG